MRVALYLRRSTNDELQPESLNIQEELLRTFAVSRDWTVVAKFADSASGRTIKKRTSFQELIDIVGRGGAQFDAILVRDVTRWGRFENCDEAAFWEFFCVSHGVKVIYVEEPFRDAEFSPYESLMKAMKRVLAAEFSREKARMTQVGQANVVRQGFMHGSPAPLGYRRILVNLDGSYAGELKPNDRKQRSNQRAKLAPGDPEAVAVVRRIFGMYAEGFSTERIAADLNAEEIPGSRGGTWRAGTIAKILANERYIGTMVYSAKTTIPSGEAMIVRTKNAHEPLISDELWRRVRERSDAKTSNRTDLQLAEEIRRAYERWGCVSPAMLDEPMASWQTYANRFRHGAMDALGEAYRAEIEAAAIAVREQIERSLPVVVRDDGTLLIDGYLSVGLTAVFPKPCWRSLRWHFAFDGTEPQDVTIGLAFSPPPNVRHVETFVFRNWKFRGRRSAFFVAVASKAPSTRSKVWNLEDVVPTLKKIKFWDSTTARQKLVDELRARGVVNLSEVARSLGWPYGTVRGMYRRILKDNPTLATLWKQPGRRIRVVCDACGRARLELPAKALHLKTHLCVDCFQKKRCVETSEIACPDCWIVRRVKPWHLRKLKYGSASRCRRCSLRTVPRTPAKKVNLVCEDCGATRLVRPVDAQSRLTTRCRPCMNLTKRRQSEVVCPDCGDVRMLSPARIARLKNGTASRCLDCNRHRDRRTRD